MTKVTKAGSIKEQPISGGTIINAGQMYVHNDTNGVIVAVATETASAAQTRYSASAIKTIDLPARFGAFPDTGTPIFEVL